MSTEGTKHYRWEDRPAETILGGIVRRYVTTERQMLGEVRFQKGQVVPVHSHDNEQFTCVMTGALEFEVQEVPPRKVMVRAGEVIVIPPNVPHSLVAIEDTLEFDLFTPPRKDWMDANEPLLR